MGMTRSATSESAPMLQADRLSTLAGYGIISTPPEPDFDALAELAASICATPVSLVNFITGDQQWSKAEIGCGARSRPLYASICAQLLETPDIVVIPDLTEDIRFCDNPTVVDVPRYRFYAAAPIVAYNRLPLGMLCVFDYEPRTKGLPANQQQALIALARQVMVLLELRRIGNSQAGVEAALRKSEARLRSAIELADIGEWTIDLRTGVVEHGEQMSPIFGHAAGTVVVERIEDVLRLIHPDDRARVDAETRRQISKGSAYELEYRVVRSDGSIGWVATRGRLLYDGEVATHLAGVTRDITAARAFSTELNRQVTQARAEFDRIWLSSDELLGEADYAGKLLRVSPSWTRLLGYAEADLLAGLYTTIIHPDDLFATTAAIATMREQNRPVRYENRILAADGRWLTIAWSLAPADDRLFAIGRDVTAERELTQAMVQAQKIDTLGQLTGGIAHDFNNLLTPIMGGIELLVRKLPDDARAQRIASGAMQSAERARTLVQRLLAFGRRQTLQSRAVKVGELLNGMTGLIQGSIGSGITLTIDVPLDLPPVLVDPGQFELAIVNLCVNARDAMPEVGALRISAAVRSNPPGVAPGNYVGLAVADNGAGMDGAVLAKATEPFFTTKDVGQGTGLGLSMVFGLAAQSGGKLNLTSQLGAGTTADLVLPVAAVEYSPKESLAPSIASVQPDAATLLVVDDEELVRMTTADTLRDCGYTVIEAASAAEVLQQLDAGLRPDLLVTDHLMPNMTGAVLVKQVRTTLPQLPVLMVTGYADLTDEDKIGLVVLAKPFRHEQLTAHVSALLAERVAR